MPSSIYTSIVCNKIMRRYFYHFKEVTKSILDQIKSIVYAAFISAAAAGLSTAWNYIIGMMPKQESE